MVKVASDRGASSVKPILIVGSKLLVDSGLDKIAPFGDLKLSRPEKKELQKIKIGNIQMHWKNAVINNTMQALKWGRSVVKLTF